MSEMGSVPPANADGDAEPRHLGRVLASSLWFPALFFVGFLVCYLIPFHAPTPHDVPVAVAGPQVAAAVEEGLAQQAPGAYDVLPVADDDAARAAIEAREAVAAYVVDGGGATLYTAGADGKLLGQVVTSTFTEVAASGGADLEVVDLVPTEAGDLTGTGLFYLALVWNLVPYVTVMMLARATELTRRGHLAVLAAVGAFISVVGYLVGLSIDVMPNDPLAIVYAFMLTQAVAWTTYGLAPLVKQFLPGVAIGLFVLLSIPSSGGAIPHQLVPGFFAALHPVMPLGNVVDALRGIFYFDGVGLLRPTLVLGAWLLGSALLVALVALRSRRLERSAGQPQGEVTAREPVEDPTLMASVPRAIDPLHHGPYREESALLGGVVRQENGVPLPHAFVTVLGEGGRQLLTTRTDEQGRYAAADLPEAFATVVLLAQGYAPAAARLLPRPGHPLRQDFDLAEASSATSRPSSTAEVLMWEQQQPEHP